MKFRIVATLTAGSAFLVAFVSAQAADTPRAAMPPELERQHMAAKAQLASRGYFEQLDRAPVSEFMLARIEQRRAERRKPGKSTAASAAGFARLENFDLERLPFPVKHVPEHAIRADSDNYILPTNTKVRRIFTKTDFGMLFVEQGVGRMVLDEPNLRLAGHDAKVVVTRHKGDKWATTIYASDASHIYRLEANRLLEGSELDAFVDYAEQMLVNR